VIEFEPNGRAEVDKLAAPLLKETLPRLVLPLLKVTEPVAVPPNCPATTAVKVTDCPTPEGFGEAVKVVVVLALLTAWLTAVEELPARVASPL
jgi:hypothetical protein